VESNERILVWFRNDLRLHDHEPLFQAFQRTKLILPVYVLASRWKGATPLGFPKIGSFRYQFLLESLQNLRTNLNRIGTNLIFRIGNPEDLITALALQYDVTSVFCYEEFGTEESDQLEKVRINLEKIQVSFLTFRGVTLHHPEDLPFSITGVPEIFTNYRKLVEQSVKVRSVFPKVRPIAHLPENLEPGEFPSLQDMGLEIPQRDRRSAFPFRGGEDTAVEILIEFLWVSGRVKSYNETRNGLIGTNYSSKLSAYLAMGVISPRFIYSQLKLFEEEKGANESTYWFFFELLWRDYFQWILGKHKSKLFRKTGIIGKTKPINQDRGLFEVWRKGETESPWVNAHMKELWNTGYMSNRGRQNVASYLVHSLQLDWRWGAEWFESQLIDYDVASNWGNWAYFAGVGNDPRARIMNMESQAKAYDPLGDFQRLWNAGRDF
jgi:deoxyribodipyrimidine photo-lyase